MSSLNTEIHQSFNKVVKPAESLSKSGLFSVESANESIIKAKGLPNPKPMIGNFWKEGELFILFAFTGTGKTVFAMQIAKAISEGKSVFKELPNECEPKKVLYYDAELSLKQFESRYSDNYRNHTEFSENLIRMYVNRDAILSEGQSIAETIIPDIENEIKSRGISVVIIDNLSTLREGLEASKEAKPLMDQLVNLKHKEKVSLMVVGHTPKQHHYKEMVLADLQGSAHLSIQLDTCVAMGSSAQDNQTKYLKEVKMRDGAYLYGADNVITVEIQKNGFLQLVFKTTEDENNHLKKPNADEIAKQIVELNEEGHSSREIENHVPYKKTKINEVIKNHGQRGNAVNEDSADKNTTS